MSALSLPKRFGAIVTLLLSIISFSIKAAEGVDQNSAWLTLETEHFLIHYTQPYRDWANSSAYELEASVDAILKQQQRDLSVKVDVVVFDAYNKSNGFAMPFSKRPIMALFTTPPQSDSIISNSTSWQQLLALHEYVHLVHIAQPSRSAWKRTLSEYWDILDIFMTTKDFPRWASEGYATLQESKLTGRGRIYDDYSEAMVRQFALEGALPPYHQLSNSEGRYQIGRMAYLVGGRFLTWLEQEYSEKTLDNVWTRLKAKKGRSFSDAFKGAFGETPDYLYQQFVVQYTAKAMEFKQKTANDKLWLDADYSANAMALSPSKQLLAVVESNKDREVFINVYETKENDKAKQDFEKQQQDLLEIDPQDVADVQPKVFTRKRVHQLEQRNWLGLKQPRWLDENTLLFLSYSVDSIGHLHQDLFKWQLGSKDVTRITSEDNIRRFDVAGNMVVAERVEFGRSSLVSIDLSAYAPHYTTLNTPSIEHVYDFPRFNPSNANQLLYLQSRPNKPWRMVIAYLDQVDEGMEVPMPAEYQFLSYPTWSKDGKNILFVAGVKGELGLYQYETDTGQLSKRLTAQQMAAWPQWLEQGDEANQESALYLKMTSRGMEIREATLMQDEPVETNKDDSYEYLTQLSASEIKMPPAFDYDIAELAGKENPYNVFKQDITASWFSYTSSTGYDSDVFGVQGSDVLGMFKWGAKLITGSEGMSDGWFVNANWQGAGKLPFEVIINAYQYDANPMEQNLAAWISPSVFQLQSNDQLSLFSGINLQIADEYRYRTGAFGLYRGDWRVGISVREELEYDVQELKASHFQRWRIDHQSWGLSQFSNVALAAGSTDRTKQVRGGALTIDSENWQSVDVQFGLEGHYQQMTLQVSGRVAAFADEGLTQFELGGMNTEYAPASMQTTQIVAPELPAYFQRGTEYSEVMFSLFSANETSHFYYKKPYMDGVSEAEIVGYKGRFNIDTFRSGLNGLVIEYGISDVTLSSKEKLLADYHNTEFWLGARYVF